MSKKVNTLKSEVKTTEDEINRLTKIVGDVKKHKRKKKELQRKIEIIDMLNRKKTGPVHMLDELSNNTPEKLWITSLKESNLKLTLDGIALDNETIAHFMRGLERSSYFSNIELIQSQQHIEKERKLKKFHIKCQVVLPERK